MAARGETPPHTEPGVDPDTAPLDLDGRTPQPGDVLDGYTFVAEVGRGGMAHVLHVRDDKGQDVALKVLRASRFETGIARFRREFHALSRLDHPNVVRVFDYGDIEGHPYIAMELVDGPDLHTVIRDFRRWDEADRYVRCEEILVDLCRALAAIHRRGLVHRDLKPSNILISQGGTCKLSDFGIVKDLDPQQSPDLSTTLVGTWAYASPEHIGGEPIDHRSDLYALGIILFAMLTGKRPFAADGMAGYLEAHRHKAAPRAKRIRPSVPDHLDAICARLLEKAPRDRFQSAREILYRLDADEPDALDVSDAFEPELVGQEAAITAVKDLVGGLTAGRGGVLRVSGDDGAGKSRMVELAAEQARMLGIPFHQLTVRTDQALQSVTVALALEVLAALPVDQATELRETLSAWTGDGELRGDARYVLYDGLRSALGILLGEGPRLVLVDDEHLAPGRESDLLRYLARHLTPTAPLALLLTTRPITDDTDPWTQGLDTTLVTLEPLSQEEVDRILEPLVGRGRHARSLAARLYAESEGNPAFLVEFVRSLVAEGLVVRRGNEWEARIDPGDLAVGHLEVPPSIRQLLTARLAQVDDAALPLVRALAISGRPLGFDVLLDVVELDEESALSAIDELIRAGIVREHRHADDLQHELVHHQLADVVRRGLDEQSTAALHADLADALLDSGSQDVDTIARIGEHEREAARPGRAFAHLVEAAGRLADRSMHEQAGRLMDAAHEIALAAQGDMPGERWTALHRQHLTTRGAVLRHRGAWDEAASAYQELVDAAADGEDERLGIDARIGLAHMRRRLDEHDDAVTAAEGALATARALHYRKGVAEALQALASISWALGDLEHCEQQADEGLLLTQGPALAAERAHLLMTRAAVQATRGQLASAVRGMAEADQLFDELRMRPAQVLALANLSELHTWQGETEEGWSRAQQAVELARGLGNALGLTVALRARGQACTDLGRFEDAYTDLQEALRSATRLGIGEEVLSSSVALTRLAIEQSDLVGAMRHASTALEATGGRDPERYLPLLHAYLARALARRRTRTAWTLIQAVEDAIPTLPEPRRLQVLLAAAWGWLALGDKARAIEHAQQLVRSPASRSFRLLNIEARMLLSHTTQGDEAVRHKRIGQELAREFTDSLPLVTSEEVRRRTLFQWFDEA